MDGTSRQVQWVGAVRNNIAVMTILRNNINKIVLPIK